VLFTYNHDAPSGAFSKPYITQNGEEPPEAG
jgi:hypothetical protein